MINRPFNTVLARLGLVAAVLATLFILAPVASAADPYEVSYAENGEGPVATFSATDPDADADDIEWSLGGPDDGLFEIDGGVLTFKESPDFEAPTDGDEDDDVRWQSGQRRQRVQGDGGGLRRRAGGCGNRDGRGRAGECEL